MTTTIDKQEKELSEIRILRNAIVSHYVNSAWDVFTKYAELSDEELAEFKRVTNNATIVYTRPSDETLEADAKSDNPRFSKGRKFGSVQWWKKSQEVGTALAVATSFASYLAYTESKANQAERDEKKLAAAAAVAGLSLEQLKELLASAKK